MKLQGNQTLSMFIVLASLTRESQTNKTTLMERKSDLPSKREREDKDCLIWFDFNYNDE